MIWSSASLSEALFLLGERRAAARCYGRIVIAKPFLRHSDVRAGSLGHRGGGVPKVMAPETDPAGIDKRFLRPSETCPKSIPIRAGERKSFMNEGPQRFKDGDRRVPARRIGALTMDRLEKPGQGSLQGRRQCLRKTVDCDSFLASQAGQEREGCNGFTPVICVGDFPASRA